MDPFLVDDHQYQLQRWPLRNDDPLRAWDTADAYLVKEYVHSNPGRLLLVNDSFGALTVGMHRHQPEVWSDSFLARLAIQHNLKHHDLPAVPFIPADTTPGESFDLVLAKLPKSLAFWEDTLLRLRSILKPGAQVVAGGMIKHTPRRAHELMETIIGPTTTGLGWKKARLAVATFDQERTLPSRLEDTTYELDGFDLTLHNAPNVFARDHLDIGTRFLLANLSRNEEPRRIVDLGCGNGALSLALALLNPRASILGVDESYQAVACARANAERADLADHDLVFEVADVLTDVAPDSVDLVVTNPPFHQAQSVGDAIAWGMFTQAKRCLSAGGRLLVVGNRHLGYPTKLERLFGNATLVDSGPKFMVVEAVKRF